MYTMHFYVTITKDGLYHVQNAIMGMMGQHHVHNKDAFKKWKNQDEPIKDEYIHISKGTCDCGLKDGQTKSGL